MNGYMDLFLETGNPAFYMMAKQKSAAAGVVAGGAAGGTACNAADHWEDPAAKEGASPR